MRRRDFLKKIPVAGVAPVMLGGIPINVLAKTQLERLVQESDNDRVIVLIQMHGGNDGLNTIIPIDQYAEYYNLRPNIAIPDNGSRKYIELDNTLAAADQVGLHPDMQDLKELYDQGRAAIVQGVAYENINQSHFRSRDIWWMGGGYDDEFSSGWIGRYLDHEYPNYPDDYPNPQMLDPLGIEIGTGVSLAFHRDNGIPAGLGINNPDQFYNLVTSVGGDPPESVENTYYGDELRWIMDIEEQSNEYAERLRDVFEAGTNSPNVTYPERYPLIAPGRFAQNGLAPQLKLIARLLSGGIKTRVFLARIGGFDTHAQQVESYNSTMGAHSALLYHLASSMKAFQNDLKGLGLEDKVLTMTFSEFGRRPRSNGSYGSDHGTAAPMFVVGKAVNAGVFGTNVDLNNLDRGNLRHQHDYRQVFTSALYDWMCAPQSAINQTKFDGFMSSRLDLISTITANPDRFFSDRYYMNPCYPNPVKNNTTFKFYINTPENVSLKIHTIDGREVKSLIEKRMATGEHLVTADLSNLPVGTYIYRLKAGVFERAMKLIRL